MNISINAQQALSQRTEQNHVSFRSLTCSLDPLGERTEFPKPHFYLKEIFLTFSQGHVSGVEVPAVVISLQALQQAQGKTILEETRMKLDSYQFYCNCCWTRTSRVCPIILL